MFSKNLEFSVVLKVLTFYCTPSQLTVFFCFNINRWMATTQFQPGHARQAFPCYDEPGFKAYFDITIVREPDFSPTISNMPIRARQE